MPPHNFDSATRPSSMTSRFLSIVLLAIVAGMPPRVMPVADAGPPESKVDYAREVLPILRKHCFACHGPQKQESNLRLDRRGRALAGGDLGEPAIVPGKPEKSLLIAAVSGKDDDLKMPPEGKRLKASEIMLLSRWISEGAGYPKQLASDDALTTKHWSFQPIRRPKVPSASSAWSRGPIDRFIQARLNERGLSPSPPADRLMMIRRLYLDMHGLPPTPAEIRAFALDQRADAYERLVDRVIASPRYGERWGRHWLDVVRFAESNGYETNRPRPTAYHYRDYVIGALNHDKTFGQFVREQLAGDSFGADAATGFLVAGPYDIVKSPDINLTLMQRQDELADIVNTTSTTFLGITVGCARCHNHKFDPILQKDYYAMQAIFSGVRHGERPLGNSTGKRNAQRIRTLAARAQSLRGTLREKGWSQVSPEINVEKIKPILAARLRFTVFATNSSEPCIDELEVYSSSGEGAARNVALASMGTIATSSGNLPGYPIHKLKHINDGRHGNSHSWISNTKGKGWVQLDFARPHKIDRVVWGRDRLKRFRDRVATDYLIEAFHDNKWTPVGGTRYVRVRATGKEAEIARLLDELKRTEAARKRLLTAREAKAYSGIFRQAEVVHRLYRGEPTAKREVVLPDTFTVMGSLKLNNKTPESVRRRRLAEWISNPKNPLAPRVMVNRIWQYHFGRGIVASPSDFGANGQLPSHPQLLDWLATELIRSGGSIKRIHKLILTSNTYRQTSAPQTKGLRRDADCRLLWRFPPRRLEAEAIRDCILFVSGALDEQMKGPGFQLFDVDPENVHHYFPKEKLGPPEWRRMVYMTKIRQEQDAIFGAFDCPDGNQTIPRRSRSTTPIQALNLFNSPFAIDQSAMFARRLVLAVGQDTDAQVRLAFAICYGRAPSAVEHRQTVAFVRQEGLPSLCRALINSNEFLFLP